ncbi:MAG: hypothetical protein AAB510_02040 [Patescibacteria group bacterium]
MKDIIGKSILPPSLLLLAFIDALYIKIIKAKIPKTTQTNTKLTRKIKKSDKARRTPKTTLIHFVSGKNSYIKRVSKTYKPWNTPNALKEPKTLSVLPVNTPKERRLGKNIRRVWKTSITVENNIIPKRSIRVFLASRKTIEEITIKTKTHKINQKVPTSSIVPNKVTPRDLENKADNKETKTTPPPPTKTNDLEKTILPSENLATIQAIKDKTTPRTKNRLLPASTEKFVKGKKNTGKRTTKKNRMKKEILSKIFRFI